MNTMPTSAARRFGGVVHYPRNHYDALGITSKATQGEIKAAYYKLSMIYHPDKNKGSDNASEKFKDITAAYEVLGNLKSRRIYDKGLGVFSGNLSRKWETETSTEYAKTNTSSPTTKGPYTSRSPIYDFDEWSRLHYGQTFERRVHAKVRYEEHMKNNSASSDFKKDNIVSSIIIFICMCIIFSYSINLNNLDRPISKTTKK